MYNEKRRVTMEKKKHVLTLITLIVVFGFVSVFGNDVFSEETKKVVVTKDNIGEILDEDNCIREDVDADELVFTGEFANTDFDHICINRPIVLSSDNAVLKNISIIINSNNVTVDGLNISITSDSSAAIQINESNNVKISNNTVSYLQSMEDDGFAIYSYGSNDLTISKNLVQYEGNCADGVKHKALYVEGSEDKGATRINVSENNFDISIPSIDVGYDPDTWCSVLYSSGVEFRRCEVVSFDDNMVQVEANGKVTTYGYDTLYGVVYSGSYGENKNNVFSMDNNTIDIIGETYSYGVSIMDADMSIGDTQTKTSISNNTIRVNSKIYSAGINADGPLDENTINDNEFDIKAGKYGYGIYLYNYMGPIKNTALDSNKISVEAPYCCGIESVIQDGVFKENEISGKGNYVFGIISSFGNDEEESRLVDNKINAVGTNEKLDYPSGDGLTRIYDADISFGVYNIKGNNCIITGNEIYTSGPGIASKCDSVISGNTVETTFSKAVDVLKSGSLVNENYLIADDCFGDDAVTRSELEEGDDPAEPLIFGNYPAELIDNVKIEISENDLEYTGQAISPKVKVYFNDKELIEGTDYTVEYKDNIEVGTATVEVTGTGNYFGTVKDTFEIKEKKAEPTSSPTPSAEPTTPSAEPSATPSPTPSIKPQVETIKVNIPGGKKFVYDGKNHTGVPEAEEYTVSGNTGTNAGSYKAVLKLKDKSLYVWSDGSTDDKTVVWSIEKAKNSLKLKKKSFSTSMSKSSKKNKKINVAKKITFSKKGEGKLTYKLKGVDRNNKKFKKYSKYFKVDSKGKLTIKKKPDKGKYKVKILVKAAGDKNHKASSFKTITYTVKVK